MKKFFVTLDTEEDRQWDLSMRESTTENAKYIPRFQELCEKYNIKPIYFTTYGMAANREFASYLRSLDAVQKCEVGMHLHGWDTPPSYKLNTINSNRPYIVEYPPDTIKEKVWAITDLLEDTFQRKIISHRAGRWSTNQQYLEILYERGYRVDSSVTPGVDWRRTLGATGANGTYYSKFSCKPVYIFKEMLEVPVSIMKYRTLAVPNRFHPIDIFRAARDLVCGKSIWLRPSNTQDSLHQMFKLVKTILDDKDLECMTFMIHTSELMPGCNPNFQTKEDIEYLYDMLDALFSYLSERVISMTFLEYYNTVKRN